MENLKEFERIKQLKEAWTETNTPRKYEQISKNRIKSIKHCFKGKKTIIFTCGPSLKNITHKHIKQFIDDGYIIICVKQAINSMPEKIAHFHVVNFCNEGSYNYNPKHIPIKLYCQRSEHNIVEKKGFDIVVSHYPNNLKDNIIVSMEKGVDDMSFDKLLERKQLKVKWGDTMFELAIPLAIHIGCTNIYIVGWDCKNFKQHFYGKDVRPKRNALRIKLDKLQIKGGACLYNFVQKQFGVIINLVGQGNESVFKIPYIQLNTLLGKDHKV